MSMKPRYAATSSINNDLFSNTFYIILILFYFFIHLASIAFIIDDVNPKIILFCHRSSTGYMCMEGIDFYKNCFFFLWLVFSSTLITQFFSFLKLCLCFCFSVYLFFRVFFCCSYFLSIRCFCYQGVVNWCLMKGGKNHL